MNKKLMKWLKILAIAFLIIAGLLFTIVELGSPFISQYRSKFEQYASTELGKPVKITELRTGWYYLEPVIRLSGISIEDNHTHTVAVIGKIGIGINWLSSLWHWKLEPNVLVVSQVKVRVDASWSRLSQGSALSQQELQEIFPSLLSFDKIILNDVSIWWKNDTGEGLPSFKISNANARLKRKIGGYYLKTDLDWHDRLLSQQKPSHIFAGISFSANLFNHSEQDGNVFIEAQNINFREIQKSILALWPKEALSTITFQRGRGDIQFHGNIEKKEDWNISDWSFSANVNNLAWKAAQGASLPSVKGLSGSAFIEPEEGTLRINTQNLRIDYPALFNHVLPFSNTNIQLEWQKNGSLWSMSTEKFQMENPEISASAECNVQWKEGVSDAVIQLTMPFTLHHLSGVRQYLPDNIMKPKLSVWLHRSIAGGTVTNGNLILKGRLSDFPFDPPNKSNGLFLVDSDFQKFTLDFKEGWPAGRLMNAHMIFRNRDLIAEIHDGTIDQLPLTSVNAQILGLGLGKETLTIQGHLKADASKARHFVLNSPIVEYLNSFNNMELFGPGIFDIDIAIPLYPENDVNLVNGKAVFLDNSLVLKKWWNLKFEHFKGDLTYNQSGVVNSNLTATLLNYPLQLNMKTVKKPTPATVVDVKGLLGIDALHKIFPIFIFDFLKGVTPYTSQLTLTTSKKELDKLVLKSTLAGISVDLPPPYKKKAAEKRPLLLSLEFSDDESSHADTQLHIDFDKLLSLYLGYRTINHGPTKEYVLHQGKVNLGGKKAVKPQEEGLAIEANLPEFSLSAWQPFFDAMAGQKETGKKIIKAKKKPQKQVKKEPKKEVIGLIQSVQLSTPNLIAADQIFHDVNLLATAENNQWLLHMKSDEISGIAQVPPSIDSGISAHLDYIHLNDVTLSNDVDSKKNSSSDLMPLDIPPLNIQVNDFRYQKMNLGRTSLITTQDKRNNALIIKQLSFQAPASSAGFQGVWKLDKGKPITQIRGSLASTNIQQTLKNLDIDPVIQGKKGELNVDLHWADDPQDFRAAILNGSISLQLNKGVITHLSPSLQEKVGLGKLLSLFSLQNIPQHLTLDFSDLSAKGLSFETLKGNFALKQGRMTTQDTALEGPIADITMTGAIDMGKRLYDLVLNITPSPSSGIPIIATIAGGPVVGLAALAATTIIHQGIKQTSMYRYKVSGPWNKPTVKPY